MLALGSSAAVAAAAAVWADARDGAEPGVIVTLDDGPHPATTPDVLTQLAHAGVPRAVFFLRGDRVLQHPALVRAIVDAGHVVGYHSLAHDNMAGWTADRVRDDIRSFRHLIRAMVGDDVSVWVGRPPYGGMTGDAARRYRIMRADGRLAAGTADGDLPAGLVTPAIREAFAAEGMALWLWNHEFTDWTDRLDRVTFTECIGPSARPVLLIHEMPERNAHGRQTFDNGIGAVLTPFLSQIASHRCAAR